MKKFEKRPRSDESTGARTGPRARAAQERRFSDPYARAQRPARPGGGFQRDEGDGAEGRAPARPAVVTLDPDVARVFRDSETVNEVLRTVMRLARFGGSRPAFSRDRPAPSFAERRGPPRSGPARSGPPRSGPPRSGPPRSGPPPRARKPRFNEE